jgi:hypothetical protein
LARALAGKLSLFLDCGDTAVLPRLQQGIQQRPPSTEAGTKSHCALPLAPPGKRKARSSDSEALQPGLVTSSVKDPEQPPPAGKTPQPSGMEQLSAELLVLLLKIIDQIAREVYNGSLVHLITMEGSALFH